MAYYSIFPEKDTTIYSHPDRKTMNSGHDEILELVKERGNSDPHHHPSRILIKFLNDDITDTISNVIGHSNFNHPSSKSYLELNTSEHRNLTTTLNIEGFAVSQSWNEGTGRYSNLPSSSNGASWTYRDNDINKLVWPTSSFSPGTSGSLPASSVLSQGGGNWYTGSGFYASQQFLVGADLDINLDVTEIIKKQSASLFANQTYPTGIINNGFIIKQPQSIEIDTSSSFGEMKYFSVNTHTIYPPRLAFKWDDSIHSHQSSAKNSGELNVSLYRNKSKFNQNSIATFRVHVRDKYPNRIFSTESNYLQAGYFTTSSYYSIRDAHTEEEVIPFDNDFTKMSADNESMYFKIYMNGLQPERYYRLLFKHENNDGITIYDENYHFKVVR